MVPERPSILVIDPDPSIRTLIVAVARRGGLEADWASDGESALEQVRARPYSAIIVEPRMPGGDALVRDLSFDGNGSRPKIIVATTPRPLGDARRWPEAEAVLMKPFDLEELTLAMAAACCSESLA